jgi:hypothetical protein
MELFTATGKMKSLFFQHLEMFDVCTTGDMANIDTMFKFLPHTCQHGCIGIIHRCNDPCRARMVLSVGGSFAHFARIARCTVTTDLLVWYSNTQNDFSLGAAIFLLHTLVSPSGRHMNYDKKNFLGKKLSFSFYLYRILKYVSYGLPIIIFL